MQKLQQHANGRFSRFVTVYFRLLPLPGIAYHEAGHVVATIFQGLQVHQATIISHGDRLGAVWGYRIPRSHFDQIAVGDALLARRARDRIEKGGSIPSTNTLLRIAKAATNWLERKAARVPDTKVYKEPRAGLRRCIIMS